MPAPNGNWVRDENITQWKKTAEKHSHERLKLEKKMRAEGKRKIQLPHPVSPRCLIEKWI